MSKMDTAVAYPSQMGQFGSPAMAHTVSWNQRVHQRPQAAPVVISVLYTINPDYSVWRRVVTNRLDVLQSSMVGRYIYFDSQQQRVFVNAPWSADDRSDPRDQLFYAAHRSHTPCVFSRITNREPVREQWPLLLHKLDHMIAKHSRSDHTDSPPIKRLKLAPP